MEKALIAIPSKNPGGLEAQIDSHFGHCELYTLVEVENGAVASVKALPSVPHQHGGCLAPVTYLADNKVTALIAGGMGMRPLQGFHQKGITVYFGGDAPTVKDAVAALTQGKLRPFGMDQTCGGGSCGQ